MPSYLDHLQAFTHFLSAYTHTVLYLRSLYPRTSFLQARFHNTPVWQNRHPFVCEWIQDAIAAVREELQSGSVSRIAIVVFSYPTNKEQGGSVKILERYMLDVHLFPVVTKPERQTRAAFERRVAAKVPLGQQPVLDKDVPPNLSEQFRAAFIALTTRCSRLEPLPKNCSFNITMELKDNAQADPPIGYEKDWIPVQPSVQATGRKHSAVENTDEGGDLGGERVMPLRAVSTGAFRFETWIEEGKAKFATAPEPEKASSSSAQE
ncbi:DNA-binding protein [Corynespora cassiicola Philippines]|uniref:DNA-binding protein n=1 Tax=Corynespora cassiicola Philippines TaxID=1448308 RepID=A0A2T2P743_CORCC|nr:DNA-binding protein [Corynespora cassiicola Philippines]